MAYALVMDSSCGIKLLDNQPSNSWYGNCFLNITTQHIYNKDNTYNNSYNNKRICNI